MLLLLGAPVAVKCFSQDRDTAKIHDIAVYFQRERTALTESKHADCYISLMDKPWIADHPESNYSLFDDGKEDSIMNDFLRQVPGVLVIKPYPLLYVSTLSESPLANFNEKEWKGLVRAHLSVNNYIFFNFGVIHVSMSSMDHGYACFIDRYNLQEHILIDYIKISKPWVGIPLSEAEKQLVENEAWREYGRYWMLKPETVVLIRKDIEHRVSAFNEFLAATASTLDTRSLYVVRDLHPGDHRSNRIKRDPMVLKEIWGAFSETWKLSHPLQLPEPIHPLASEPTSRQADPTK